MNECMKSNTTLEHEIFIDCYCPKYAISNLILAIVAAICLVLLLLGTRNLIKTFKTSNKLLLAFFINLNLSLVLRVAFFISEYFSRKDICSPMDSKLYASLNYLSRLFLSNALIFHLFNWAYNIKKIKEYSGEVKKLSVALTSSQMSTEYKQDQKKDCYKNTLIILLTSTLILNFCLHIVFVISNFINSDNFHKIDKINRGFGAGIYIILCIAFFAVGYYMYRRLLSVSYFKSSLMIKRIKMSVILIAAPIFIRAIYSIAKMIVSDIDQFKLKSLCNNDYYYPLFHSAMYFFLDLIPMGLQFWCIKMVCDCVSQPQEYRPCIGAAQTTFTMMHFTKRSEDAISSNSKRTSSSINSWRNESEGSAFHRMILSNGSCDIDSNGKAHLLSADSPKSLKKNVDPSDE